MAGSRLALHDILIEILGTQGQTVSRVYFQPPSTVKLEYPCIIYSLSDQKDFFSGDRIYFGMNKYLVTIVDKNPDSLFPEKVHDLPYSAFSTKFNKDGLNHTIYSLYF